MELPANLNFTTLAINEKGIPFDEFPLTISWRWNFGGMTLDKVKAYLCSEHEKPEFAKFSLLVEYLLQLEPKSIVRNSDDTWLRLISSKSGCSLYLSCKTPAIDVTELLVANSLIQDFHKLFSGLRTESPSTAGSFLSSEITTLEDLGGVNPSTKDWASALSLYHSVTGDHLLVREGELAWYTLGEGKVKPLANSFSSVLQRFVSVREQAKTFDSFS